MAKQKDPFSVKLSAEDEQALTRRLCDAIRVGLEGRTTVIQDGGFLDFAYSLYEQQPQMGISRTPRQGAADLTSPIGTQMVDTLTSMTVKAMFDDEPFLIAEGIGPDAGKQAAVEEFMQWRIEEMRGQATARAAIQQSYIEEGAVLEVCEDAQEVNQVEVIKAKIARDELGAMLLDGKTGKPMAMRDEGGEPVEADDLEEYVEVRRQYTEVIRRGASLRTHSLKDFLFLPGHARDRRDVWGMAVRFWMPLSEVTERADHGQYDQKKVDLLGNAHEREQRAEHDRQGLTVEVDHGSDKVEKELWRLQFYANLDGKGLCFYIATISLQHECILRLQHDWIGRFRFGYLNPYPRPHSVYGHSLILHKLLTTIEGHTAWRNMNADRGMLKANAPLKKLNGALWEPEIQPFAPGGVIIVGSMDEVMPFEFEDVSQHAFAREREFYEEAARIAGINDILASVNPKVQRTLGENEMVTQQSFTRAEDPVRNIQETFEDIGELIHAIEVKTLKEMEERGESIDLPGRVNESLQRKMQPDPLRPGDDAAFVFSADMVDGRMRFKPRGSLGSADPNRRLNNLVNGLKTMGMAKQMFPALAVRYDSPPVADAVNQMLVDVLEIRDKAPFLAPLPPPMPPQGMLPPGMPPGGPQPGAGIPPGGPGMPPAMGPGGPPAFGDAMIEQMLATLPQGAAQ